MTASCNNTKSCILQCLTLDERQPGSHAALIETIEVPPDQYGLADSSLTPGSSGSFEEAFDKLQANLLLQMDKRHNNLLAELHGLRDELLERIAGISSTSSSSVQNEVDGAFKEAQRKFPSNGGPDPMQMSSAKPQLGRPDSNQMPSATPPQLGSPDAKQISSTTPPQPGRAQRTIASSGSPDSKQMSSDTPQNGFVGRPNLHAFMQAKDWDSQEIATIEHNLHAGNLGGDSFQGVAREQDAQVSTMSCMEKLRQLVQSEAFDVIVIVAIFGNAIVMALDLEYEGEKTAASVGLPMDPGGWPEADAAFSALEYTFTNFFLAELILRLVTTNICTFFKSAMNWLDFISVTVSVLGLYASVGGNLKNITFLRLLRFSKTVKVVRVCRILDHFKSLRLLLASIGKSLVVLAWSLVLLVILQCAAAIFMAQSLQSFMRDSDHDIADRQQVFTYYGTFARAYMTIFDITLAPGTWGGCGRTIIHKVGSGYTFFFLFYMSTVSFTIIRVITAMFLKETLSAAAKDSEIVMAELNKSHQFLNNIRKAFCEIDKDKNGIITLEELSEMLEDKAVVDWLQILGINPHEVQGVFVLMDDGDDEITFSEFVSAVMRLKNASKGVDLATILYENKKILKRVLAVGKSVSDVGQCLERQIPM